MRTLRIHHVNGTDHVDIPVAQSDIWHTITLIRKEGFTGQDITGDHMHIPYHSIDRIRLLPLSE